MSGYVITEEDFWALENTRDMADLLATGMAHASGSAEVLYPKQVEATARCLARMIDRALQRARFDMEARSVEDEADA